MTTATTDQTDQPAPAKPARVCPYCRERPVSRSGSCEQCQSVYLSGGKLVVFDGTEFGHGGGPSTAEWLERTYGPGDGFKRATLITDEERAALSTKARKSRKAATSSATTEGADIMPKTTANKSAKAATTTKEPAPVTTAKRVRGKAAAAVSTAPAVEEKPVTEKPVKEAKTKKTGTASPNKATNAKTSVSRSEKAESAAPVAGAPSTAPVVNGDSAERTNGHAAPKGRRAARQPLTFQDGQGGTSRDIATEDAAHAVNRAHPRRARRAFAGSFDAAAILREIAAARRSLDKLENMVTLAGVQPDEDYAPILRANDVPHVAPAAPAVTKAAANKAGKGKAATAPAKPAKATASPRAPRAAFNGNGQPSARASIDAYRQLFRAVTAATTGHKDIQRGVLPNQDERLPRAIIRPADQGGMTLAALARDLGYKSGRVLADDIVTKNAAAQAARAAWR